MFLRTKTVDKAIAPLLKAQADLADVFNERTDTINRNHVTISELQDDNVQADAERTRADRIRTALAVITDPKE